MIDSSDFICVSQLGKRYSGALYPALSNIDFTVTKGSICAIIGRSGAGKTTLLRCLNGLESFDQGSISIDGVSFFPLSHSRNFSLRPQVGTVFQGLHLLSQQTVLNNIALPALWAGDSMSQVHERARQLMSAVGIEDKENWYPHQLSGGQRQRVAIARALITQAPLLLCDEPTSALDLETSADILDLLQTLNHTLGITIVLITHDLSVVRSLSQHVIVMDRGQIVEKGTMEAIFTEPSHPTTRSLLLTQVTQGLPPFLAQQLIPLTPDNHPDRSPPEASQQELLIHLTFSAQTSTQPLLAEWMLSHQIPVNILLGSLDHFQKKALGSLVIGVKTSTENLYSLLRHMTDHGVTSYLLGYLP